ncbi:hypothetical protein D3C75_759490 [compost metagenome]
MCTDSVIPQVGREAQLQIGIHSVQPFFLQLVSPQLVDQADTSAFLAHVEQHTSARSFNLAQRRFKLRAAVAAVGMEHIAGEAFGMHTHQHRIIARDIAFDQGNMLLVVHLIRIGNGLEVAEVCRQVH